MTDKTKAADQIDSSTKDNKKEEVKEEIITNDKYFGKFILWIVFICFYFRIKKEFGIT